MLSNYDILLRKLLFMVEAEEAHSIIKKLSKFYFPFQPNYKILNLEIKGEKLSNPLGLAAGFDKDGKMISFLSSLGFGYITLGSVLLRPNMGNPKPRIIRYPKYKSMTNSMGLPSIGLEKFLENLKKQRRFAKISISIAGNTLEEFKKLYSSVSKYANFIELNLSCPNTENGRLFQEIENFDKLSYEIAKIKNRITFVKISPPLNKKDIENHLTLADMCIKRNIDGITATNTLPIRDRNLATKQGGLSGKLIFNFMLRTVKMLYEEVQGKLIINACGGIFSHEDAIKAMMLGANTFQIYTAFVYEGISLPNRILKRLDEFLKNNKFSNINEIVGYKIK